MEQITEQEIRGIDIVMKRKNIYTAGMAALLLGGLLCGSTRQERQREAYDTAIAETGASQMEVRLVTELYAGALAEFRVDGMAEVEKNRVQLVAAANREVYPTDQIYSFLQGPKSWGEGRTWSGDWSLEYVKGNYFGNFGCGLCCMANIYSTLTEYTCSPWDMFEYARQVSGYSPTKKVGAIGWCCFAH